MLIDGTHQRLGVSQRFGQLLVCHFLLGDVAGNRHIAQKLTVVAMLRL